MSEPIWVHSKWTLNDLHGESIEFKLPVPDGEAQGLGQLIAIANPDGRLSIDIRTILRGQEGVENGTYNFHLNQWAADRIERHPNRSTADFRCLG